MKIFRNTKTVTVSKAFNQIPLEIFPKRKKNPKKFPSHISKSLNVDSFPKHLNFAKLVHSSLFIIVFL